MVIERGVDGDKLHLLTLQEVDLAAVVAVVVFVAQAAAEAVEVVSAVVMLPAAEAETWGVELTEPLSPSAKHKPKGTDQMATHNTHL